MNTARPAAPGLYVHAPFCVSKCPYCAFASGTDLAPAERWAFAVIDEAQRKVQGFVAPFDSLYLGGGTPSVLPPDLLTTLAFGLAPYVTADAERTIEANPGDTTAAWLEAALDAGFGRLSLGVQALDDASLRFLGRRHDAADAVAAVRAARAAGFGDVGVDLIYGLPGQTVDGWLATLAAAVALGPDHVSAYALSIDEGTPFATRGEASPDDDRLADLFLAGSDFLQKHGFEHYEVSNFAKAGFRARHNAKYWARVPYLGLGPAAHSFDGERRWWNPTGIGPWLDAIEAGRDPAEGAETLSDADARLERLMLGLRTREGTSLADVGDAAALARFAGGGFVVVEGERVRPTVRGMLVADRMAAELG